MKEAQKQQIKDAKTEQKLKTKVEKELQINLNYAKKIQLSLLPRYLSKTSEYEFSAYYAPIETIGGDLYDALYVNDSYLVFYIADVAGHGIPAAMLTVFVKHSLEVFSYFQDKKMINSPLEVLKKLNKKMIDAKFEGHPQVTMFYCIYEVKTRILTYSSIGHPPAIYIKKNNTIEQIGKPCLPGGWVMEMNLYEKQLELSEGDKIILYTDGLYEDLKKSTGFKDGFDVILNIIEHNKQLPISKLINKIVRERDKIKLKTQEDDIALLGFEIKEK